MTTQTQRMQRDIHMTGQDLMGMVQLRPQDVGKYAIVPGPKERLDGLMKKIESPVKNFSFMEYTMYTGTYAGVKVTGINGGRFAADTSITTEILCNAQVKCLIRIGSCGALTNDIKIGDLIVATGCVRGDGVTPYYVDKDFETKPDAALTQAITKIAQGVVAAVRMVGRIEAHSAVIRRIWQLSAIIGRMGRPSAASHAPSCSLILVSFAPVSSALIA